MNKESEKKKDTAPEWKTSCRNLINISAPFLGINYTSLLINQPLSSWNPPDSDPLNLCLFSIFQILYILIFYFSFLFHRVGWYQDRPLLGCMIFILETKLDICDYRFLKVILEPRLDTPKPTLFFFFLLLLSLIFDTRSCLKHLATQEVACSSIWTFQNRRLLALIQVPPTWHPLEEAHSHCLYLQSYFFVTSQNLWPQVRVGM